MGKIDKTYADELLPDIPDRNANRVRVYKAPNGEVTIHHRMVKIVLHSPEEIAEWRDGFREALAELQRMDYLKDDK